MTQFKRILVPTDLHATSDNVLDVAISVAKAFDAELTLLHVWEIPIYPYMDVMMYPNLVNAAEDRAGKRLAEALAGVRKSLPSADSKLMSGVAWSCILDAIGETGADLVVMGTHGRHGLSHVIMGSVAEKIVRHSPVPVLTVRPAKHG